MAAADIRALSLADTNGILRLIVDPASNQSCKDAGFQNVTEVIGVLIEDPAIESVTNAGILRICLLSLLRMAIVIVRVDEKAEAALKKAGVKVVEQSEIIKH